MFTFTFKFIIIILMQLLKKTAPFYYLLIFYTTVSFISRIILLLHPITQSSFTAIDTLTLFVFGFLSDFFIFILLSGFLWLTSFLYPIPNILNRMVILFLEY